MMLMHVFLLDFDQLGLHCKMKIGNRCESLYIYIYITYSIWRCQIHSGKGVSLINSPFESWRYLWHRN